MRTMRDEYLLRVRQIALAQCRADAARDDDAARVPNDERYALAEAA